MAATHENHEITQGKHFQTRQAAVETYVARMLRAGSVLAALLIAAGIATLTLGMGERAGTMLVTAGLIALVLTPVLRVATAFVVFLQERDRAFALISFFVLASIAVGVFLGKTH